MLISHIWWVFLVWLATLLMGLMSLPACRLIFSSFSDKGYAFSKIVGWFSVSYLAFLLATLKLLPLAFPALLTAVFLWLAFNFYLFLRKPGKLLPDWRTIIVTEVIFLLAFSGLLLVKSFQPEIYQIERFMDYGFIAALRNSNYLPLQDIWFAGTNLNYYYFGHFIGFVVLSLTNIDTLPGFYLLVALIFSSLSAAIYRLGSEIASSAKGGILSVFAVLIAGTWYMVPLIFKKLLFYLGKGENPYFFYPEPTRVIAGTITEMPIYSFIVAELHAHVWGLLSGVLVLAILYAFWRDNKAELNKSNSYLWALAFILGLSYMINSWDALTLGFLSMVVLVLKYWRNNKIRIIFYSLLLAVLAYLISLPWAFFNRPPIEGLGFIFFPSRFWPFLSFWGQALMVPLVCFFLIRKKPGSLFPKAIMATGVFFIILIELIYVKDILLQGEWYRANTVFKVSMQVWLWLNVFAGPVFVWFYFSLKKRLAKVIALFILFIYIFIGSVYPVIALRQSSLGGRSFTGIARGLDWWQNLYPDDYQAYVFLENLKKNLPEKEKMKIIVEAEGDSYTDVSRFSVFLGWSTIVGWPVHEWTWRGSYGEVGKRRDEVREIYTGSDDNAARQILDKYSVDYIIVGQIEKMRYGELLQAAKLRKLGSVIFEKGNTFVVEYSKQKNQVCFENQCFQVELALTQQEQAKGLMFREKLDENKGMLFVFKEEAVYPFWMRNTLIPLDIIWLNYEKEVVFISKNTQPCPSDLCPSINPEKTAKYVLELNAGTADKIGLQPGDQMTHK